MFFPALRTYDELKIMRENGIIAANTLKKVKQYSKAGVNAYEIDRIAEDYIKSNNAEPAFKSYHGFGNTLCVSVNEEIVHGIPNKNKVFKHGDIVSVDVGVFKKGLYSDCAVTFVIGEYKNPLLKSLVETTKYALNEAIKQMKLNCNIYDISFIVQSIAESAGFSVVRDYAGHGIGRKLHEKPQVLNYIPGKKLRRFGYKLKNGNVIAIEPMLNVGSYKTEVLKDGWTVVTKDRKQSAHFEHTIALYKNKPWIMTEI